MPRLRYPLHIRLPDGWTGEVLDLSIAGLRIRSVLQVKPGDALEATLFAPGHERAPVLLRVEVVWVNPPDLEGEPAEIGLALLEVPQAYHELLADLFADAPPHG